MRTFSWTGLGGQPEPPPAAPDRIVRRRAALVEGLEAPLAVPADAAGQLLDERLRGPAAPDAVVEELDPEPAEEALARGVVRRAALPRHRPGHARRPARRDPVGGAVVPAQLSPRRQAA